MVQAYFKDSTTFRAKDLHLVQTFSSIVIVISKLLISIPGSCNEKKVKVANPRTCEEMNSQGNYATEDT